MSRFSVAQASASHSSAAVSSAAPTPSLPGRASSSAAGSRSGVRDSRGLHWRLVLARTGWCAAALAASLPAGVASAALSFNFSFGGLGRPTTPTTVTGTVSGLVDNLPNQTTGVKVIITSATNTPPGGWPTFSTYFTGDGFDVAQGQITGVNVAFRDQGKFLYLGNQGILNPQLEDPTSNPVYENVDPK